MFAWIAQNALTLAVCEVLLAAIAAAVLSIVKDKKNKKGGCTGSCATCGASCPYNRKK